METEIPLSGMSNPEARLGLRVEDLWDGLEREPQLSLQDKLNSFFQSNPLSSFPVDPSFQGSVKPERYGWPNRKDLQWHYRVIDKQSKCLTENHDNPCANLFSLT